MEQTECSKTLAHKIQMPGNYSEENIQQVFVCCWMNDLIKQLLVPLHNLEEWNINGTLMPKLLQVILSPIRQ
jgi:hypothetical protein